MITYIIKYLTAYINKPTFTCIHLPYINKYKHKTLYKFIRPYIFIYHHIYIKNIMHININIYKHKYTYPYIHKQINLYILILFFTSILLSYLYSLLPYYCFIPP